MAKWSSLPTVETLDMAIERIKNEGGQWPPSIASLCHLLKPSMADFGLPEFEDAFHEASMWAQRPDQHAWSHPAVLEAGRATGFWDIAHASREQEIRRVRTRFGAEYEAICNRIIAGEDVKSVAMIESDTHKAAFDRAAEEAERRARAESEAFWARRGEEPPKTANEAISRLRSLLDEGGAA